MDRRPPGGPALHVPGLRRDYRRRTGARHGRRDPGPARGRDRRRRRLFGLPLDRGDRAGAGGQFSARPLPGDQLRRPRALGGDVEAAGRTLSRRRAADLNLRHGAADRYGGTAALDGPGRAAPPQSGPRGRISVQDRQRDRLGSLWLHRMPDRGVPGNRLRQSAHRAAGRARRRKVDGHRHRVLFGADRHRLAHLRRARHAHQHRHRDRDGADRFDRRGRAPRRRRIAGPGAGDDAGPGRRRRARCAGRGGRRLPRRHRVGRARHRHLRQPQRRAGRRRGHAGRAGGARKGRSGRGASC